MRHPFDGINRPTRRTWLGLIAAVGAYLGFGAVNAAAPPRRRPDPDPDPNPPKRLTEALGEAGGVTTKAVGEEGGAVTTKAVGEEGASTRALGEEGGVTRARGEAGGPIMTTLAIGEEGAKKP